MSEVFVPENKAEVLALGGYVKSIELNKYVETKKLNEMAATIDKTQINGFEVDGSKQNKS